jgi:hypothetical protein
MTESHWDDLRGRTVRYRDRTWELTGDLEVHDTGELLAIDGRGDDDTGVNATLYFGLQGSPESINPGNLGEHFDRIERTPDGQFIVVNTGPRTYRYKLHRLEQT